MAMDGIAHSGHEMCACTMCMDAMAMSARKAAILVRFFVCILLCDIVNATTDAAMAMRDVYAQTIWGSFWNG